MLPEELIKPRDTSWTCEQGVKGKQACSWIASMVLTSWTQFAGDHSCNWCTDFAALYDIVIMSVFQHASFRDDLPCCFRAVIVCDMSLRLMCEVAPRTAPQNDLTG